MTEDVRPTRCHPRRRGIALAIACVMAAGVTSVAFQTWRDDTPGIITLPPELDRVLRDYESAWRDGDGARLAALFVEDGFAIQNGSPLRRGRRAIAEGVSAPGGQLTLAAYAYAASGETAHIVGGYRYPDTRGQGGRFVLALRKGAGGRWLIAADLDNAGPRR